MLRRPPQRSRPFRSRTIHAHARGFPPAASRHDRPAPRRHRADLARGPAVSRAVLIDCDPGTDDAVALWLALASPELDLRLVTVAGGNVGLERTLPNARAVLG
ncbi:nucleoside hydrolase, partial [Teichococcus aerofrigidensis]